MNENYDPKPVQRRMMVKAAAKMIGRCPSCAVERPLHPVTGKCWPCDSLDLGVYPDAAISRETLAHGALCNDCAFRPTSSERLPDPVVQQACAHIPMPGNDERSPETIVDLVLLQARNASGIFWCHKPFLEPQQQWGWDARKVDLVPLQGPHWRPCGGWCKAFDKAHGVKDGAP